MLASQKRSELPQKPKCEQHKFRGQLVLLSSLNSPQGAGASQLDTHVTGDVGRQCSGRKPHWPREILVETSRTCIGRHTIAVAARAIDARAGGAALALLCVLAEIDVGLGANIALGDIENGDNAIEEKAWSPEIRDIGLVAVIAGSMAQDGQQERGEGRQWQSHLAEAKAHNCEAAIRGRCSRWRRLRGEESMLL